ncbi:MAG: hypothetical protein [Caudoviricetes sp.]|nr:MAG: hypothetical protein [Caudoviricetes sp.]
MKLNIYHTNKELTLVSNFKKLCYQKSEKITEVSVDNIDQFLLEQVVRGFSITFVGDSIVTIPKENIESLVFTK